MEASCRMRSWMRAGYSSKDVQRCSMDAACAGEGDQASVITLVIHSDRLLTKGNGGQNYAN